MFLLFCLLLFTLLMVVFRRLGREEKEKRTSNRPVGRFVSLHNRYTPSIQS